MSETKDREGKVSVVIKDGQVTVKADLWMLWVLLGIILIVVGKQDLIPLLEQILAALS